MISKNIFNNLIFFGKDRISNFLIYGVNFASLSYILIIFNVTGNHQLAISIALLQAFLTIITIGLSANYRSFALSNFSQKNYLLKLRFLIILFALTALSVIIFIFNINYPFLLLLLGLRKLLDWFEEVFIINNNSSKLNLYYLTTQILFITFFPFLDFNNNFLLYAYLIIWNLFTIILLFNFYYINLIAITKSSWRFLKSEWILKMTLATLIPTLVGFAYRYRAFKIFDIQTAAKLISSLTVSGAFTSFLIYVFLPEFIFKFGRSKAKKYILGIWAVLLLTGSAIIILITYLFKNNIESLNLSYKFLILGIFTGLIYFISNMYKTFLIQKYNISSLTEEASISLIVLTFIILSRHTDPLNYYIFLPFIGAIMSLIIYDIRNVYLKKIFGIKNFLYIILFFTCIILIALLLLRHEILFKNLLFNVNSFSLFALIFLFFNRIFKHLFTSFNSLLFLSFILLSWVMLIEKYLHSIDINIFLYIFLIAIVMTQYLFTNICKFINLNFIYHVLFLYLMSSVFFFIL